MKQYLSAWIVSALFLAACNSEKVSEVSTNGISVRQYAQEVSAECPQGGVKLELGFDKNGNNELDTAEVIKTEWVCNGKDGADGKAGAEGEQGEKGEPGDKGQPGDKGDKGDKGETGLTGNKGDKGDKGDQGFAGQDGARGLNCWDLNGDDLEDLLEDINGDLEWNALDCAGDKGETGLTGNKGDKGDKGDQGEPGIPAGGSWAGAYGNGTAVFAKNTDYVWSSTGPMKGINIDGDKKVFTVAEAGVYHITYRLTVLRPMGLKRWASVALFVNGVEQPASRRSVAGGGEISTTALLDIPEGATVSLRNVGAHDLFPVDSPGEPDDPQSDAPSIVFIKLN